MLTATTHNGDEPSADHAQADAIQMVLSRVGRDRKEGWQGIGDLCNGHPERVAAAWRVCCDAFERETDLDVLYTAVWALGVMDCADPVEGGSASVLGTDKLGLILSCRALPSAEVRLEVARAIPTCSDLGDTEDPRAIDALLEIMRDDDEDVRDWATFGLGTQLEADSPAIRDALAERLSDTSEQVAAEAMVGLAIRGDERSIDPTAAALTGDNPGTLHINAAMLIGSEPFLPTLLALRES